LFFFITVLKPGTNKVIADVKVVSQGQQNGNEAPKVETEVDIPDQGIAQTFEGYEDDEVPARNPMAFTPKAVAEYLLVSGDLEGFFSALEELVAAKVVCEYCSIPSGSWQRGCLQPTRMSSSAILVTSC
jgi:hypothetical protein